MEVPAWSRSRIGEYGGALKAGFAAMPASYIITIDADLSHRPNFLRNSESGGRRPGFSLPAAK